MQERCYLASPIRRMQETPSCPEHRSFQYSFLGSLTHRNARSFRGAIFETNFPTERVHPYCAGALPAILILDMILFHKMPRSSFLMQIQDKNCFFHCEISNARVGPSFGLSLYVIRPTHTPSITLRSHVNRRPHSLDFRDRAAALCFARALLNKLVCRWVSP